MTALIASPSGQQNQVQPQHNFASTAILVGVAAAGMTIFNKEGPYAVSDFGVTIAVALGLIAFMGPLARTWFQSVAFAAVLGGCAVPFVGYIIILFAGANAPTPGGYVDNVIGMTSWVTTAFLVFGIDRYRNRTSS